MPHTITVRLPDELAEWLEKAARRAGVSRGRIVPKNLKEPASIPGIRSFAWRVRFPGRATCRFARAFRIDEGGRRYGLLVAFANRTSRRG
jgi:hypothetical protein